MPFANHRKVEGANLLEFLRWARKSFQWTGVETLPDNGVLALPPIQRNAAWDPRQVVDAWDSVFRGLPLGAFMLQRREGEKMGVGLGADARIERLPQGWDLLDGQQRVRSLLLGIFGYSLEKGMLEKRCLWINLDSAYSASDRYVFDLKMTSGSQPFGYQPTGYKLAPRVREIARNRFEPPSNPPDGVEWEISTGNRRAYNHELFGGFIESDPGLHLTRLHRGDAPPHLIVRGANLEMPPNGYPVGWPPPPEGVALTASLEPESNGLLPVGSMIMPLHVILQEWINTTGAGPKQEALARLVGRGHNRFHHLLAALQRFEKAEIALVNASSVEGHDLPLLYDRIGAGGTPLSNEERLFSFYKFHRPYFHDIVRDIYERSGNVMVPSKIAASAIRIANALAHQERDARARDAGRTARPSEGNGLPAITQFAKALTQGGVDENDVNLPTSLDELVGAGPHIEGRFTKAFVSLFKALRFNLEVNPLGLPTVQIWRLPPSLIQVLLFWLGYKNGDILENSDDLIRFAMLWLLCSRNDDKLSTLCFRLIREDNRISLQSLFETIKRDAPLVLRLITPEEMTQILVLPERSARWRSLQDRIGRRESQVVEFVNRWWWDQANFLPWLQRAYLAEAFLGFDPTADREDDTPYDVDHIVPANDWGCNWAQRYRLFPPDLFTEDERERLRWIRGELGNSIGNKWLVDYSSNRAWGDKSFCEKILDIEGRPGEVLERLLEVFPAEFRHLWVEASPENGVNLNWDSQRLSGFQAAVETRAAWLYKRLYSDLGFSEWMQDAPTSQ